MTTQSKKTTPPPIVFLLIGLAAAFGLWKFAPHPFNWPQSIMTRSNRSPIADRSSLGDKILISGTITDAKQAGVEAFAKGDYQAAAQFFQTSLQTLRNDPESLIYLNNAKVSDRPARRIAVVVPIGSNPNIAQEILRGVAQAQNEINAAGGMNGTGLQVQIINDNNDPDLAKQTATAIANDPEILAVVGHNASNASLAAAPIYQQAGVVMISPTSFATGLSSIGSYIFRTAPNLQQTTTLLAEYMVQTAQTKRIAVCYDSQSVDNVSFKDEFAVSLSKLGGETVPIMCDLSTANFDPNQAIEAAISNNAQGILLAPHIDRIKQAIDVAHANRGRLALFSSPSLYTIQTLAQGQTDVNGLVLPAAWHPDIDPGNPFPAHARQLWGGVVNWRTATSYDATRAIITALEQSTSRSGIQQVLRNPAFTTAGSGESVRFLPTGDRVSQSILLRVDAKTSPPTFVPIR